MDVYYLDYVNGNNANNGSTWALAKKDLAQYTSLVAGDEVRIAKSNNPTLIGTATWTDLSKAVVFDSALPLINVDDCEAGFTAGTGVTLTYDTSLFKSGTKALKAVNSGAIAGGNKLFYKAITAIGTPTGYRAINLWIRNSSTIAGGVLRIYLSSDTTGDNSNGGYFDIPNIPSTLQWTQLVIVTSSDITNVNSISVWTTNSYAANTIWLDNIFISKHPSTNLNLASLISKNSNATGGNEPWIGIQCVDIASNTIYLDNDTSTKPSDTYGTGYSGTTENVNTYFRDVIKTALNGSSSASAIQTPSKNGNSTNFITFSGGWNKVTNLQDGETFFDGQSGQGYGITHNGNYLKYDRLSFVRYYYAFNNSSYGLSELNFFNIANCYSGVWNNTGSSCKNITFNIKHLVNCRTNTIQAALSTLNIYNLNSHAINPGISSYAHNNVYNITNANNHYGSAIVTSGMNCVINVTNCNNCGKGNSAAAINSQNKNIINNSTMDSNYRGLDLTDGTIVNNVTISNSTNGSIYVNYGGILYNCVLNDATEFVFNNSYATQNIFISSTKHDGIDDNHLIYTGNGNIITQKSIMHSDKGLSWKLSPTINNAGYDTIELNLCKVPYNANSSVTIKAWMYRNNTGITGRLIVKGMQPGIINDIYTDMTADANTWQEVTLTFTPTAKGVANIYVQAFGGTTYSVYVHDITIS